MPNEDDSERNGVPATGGPVIWGGVDVTEEMRPALQKSTLWTGMTNEERWKVIQGEMALLTRRKRSLEDWITVGEAIEIFQQEIVAQSGGLNNMGTPYNRAWKRLAPQQMSDMDAPKRSRIHTIWRERNVLRAWWETVPGPQRDRWGNPATILKEYERAQRTALTDPPRDEDENQPRRREPSGRRGTLATLDEATQNNYASTEDLRGVVRHVVEVTGGPSPLNFDLSTPEMRYESWGNFRQIYGGLHGNEAMQHFLEIGIADMRDEGVWVPGSNFAEDEPAEIAAYWYRLDPEKAMQVARAIEALWRAQRGLPEPEPTTPQPRAQRRPTPAADNRVEPPPSLDEIADGYANHRVRFADGHVRNYYWESDAEARAQAQHIATSYPPTRVISIVRLSADGSEKPIFVTRPH
jgi:hypothetical protein